jgi:hypothetical protein
VDQAPGDCHVLCSVITDHAIRFPLAAGQTVYVETRATMGVFAGHVRPRPVSASAGIAGARKCSYSGSR